MNSMDLSVQLRQCVTPQHIIIMNSFPRFRTSLDEMGEISSRQMGHTRIVPSDLFSCRMRFFSASTTCWTLFFSFSAIQENSPFPALLSCSMCFVQGVFERMEKYWACVALTVHCGVRWYLKIIFHGAYDFSN